MDIKELEKIMIEHGLVIRAVPKKVRSVFEKQHIDKFPDGKIEYLERYKREVLVVDQVPKNAGKFIIECAESACATIRFSGEKFYDSVEEAVEDFLKNDKTEIQGETI